MHNTTFWLGVASVVASSVLPAQALPKRTAEEMKALTEAHRGDFDYLLGEWDFTSESKQYGKLRGFWTAVRVGNNAEILDEFRVVGDDGETYFELSTLRAYNARLDQWELISTDGATGLRDFGTGRRVGNEMHLEQKFGVMSDEPSASRIRYYNIQPDRFSWIADKSVDGGKTWEKESLKIEARRIGPARSLGPLAPFRKGP